MAVAYAIIVAKTAYLTGLILWTYSLYPEWTFWLAMIVTRLAISAGYIYSLIKAIEKLTAEGYFWFKPDRFHRNEEGSKDISLLIFGAVFIAAVIVVLTELVFAVVNINLPPYIPKPR